MHLQEAVGEYASEKKYGESEEAISNYEFRLEPFVEFCKRAGIERLSRVTDSTISAYKRERTNARASPNTYVQQLRTLKDFLRFFEDKVQTDLSSLTFPNLQKGFMQETP